MNVPTTLDPALVYTREWGALRAVERCVAALCPRYFFGCGYPAGDDWVHALDLVGPDPHHLRRVMARAASPDATEAASSLVRSYTTALVVVATTTYLASPYVPDLAPANLRLQIDAQGAVGGLALREGRCITVAASDDAALRCWLWQTIVHEHLAALIGALHPQYACPQDLLWNIATTACANVLVRFDGALADAPRRAA